MTNHALTTDQTNAKPNLASLMRAFDLVDSAEPRPTDVWATIETQILALPSRNEAELLWKVRHLIRAWQNEWSTVWGLRIARSIEADVSRLSSKTGRLSMSLQNDEESVSLVAPVARLAYRVKDLCTLLSMSKTIIWDDIRSGRLVSRRRDGVTLVLHDDVVNYLNSLPINPPVRA